jgi:outer membrane protein assembly factor BamB
MLRASRFRNRPRAAGLFAALLCAGLAAAAPLAEPQAALRIGTQDAPARPRHAATAALPESNEAMLLASRADDAVERGDFALAIRLIEQIMELPDALVADPDSPVYYPVWRQARRLLEALPPDGITYYRQLVDPEAAARFREAVTRGDVGALRELFRAYPASSVSDQIGAELAARLMEAGEFARAVEIIRELDGAQISPADRFALRARLIVSLADVDRLPQGRERLSKLREWYDRLDTDGMAGRRRGALVPELGGATLWQQPLAQGEADLFEDEAAVSAAVDQFRRLPLIRPLVTDGALIVRAAGRLTVFDPLSLGRRWQVPEVSRTAERTDLSMPRFGRAMAMAPDGERNGDSELSMATRNLLFHALAHTAAAGFGNVYTVESVTLLSDESAQDEIQARMFRGRDDPAFPNQLVARELATGRQAWRVGADPTETLYGVAFQDAPIVVGEHLVVPLQRGDDLLLAVLDPASGRLLREVPIVGPPTVLTPAGGRCLLAQDDTTVYVCTGNGVIAAISQATWEWKWAATYDSSLGSQLATRMMMWRTEYTNYDDAAPIRPIVAGDLLIAAPLDSRRDQSHDILAFDRYSGRLRWRIERGDTMAIAAADDRLILCGNRITCVDLADGGTARWRSIPVELTGEPAVAGGRVYVPTRDALLALDVNTGKIVDDRLYGPGESSLLALVGSERALLAATPTRVTKFPDIQATRQVCERLLEARPGDPRALLALAATDLLGEDYQAALGRFETFNASDPGMEAQRDRMLVRIFVALSREAPEADRLAWLRRAEALSKSPQAAGQMSVLIGRALEDAQRWGEALDHYRGKLLTGESLLISDDGRSVAGWLHAAGRIRVVLDKLSEPERGAWLEKLSADAAETVTDAAVLERLFAVVTDGVMREPLQRVWLLSAPAPEIAVRRLPPMESPGVSIEMQRELHLARWEAHLACDMLDEAERDRDHWFHELAPPPSSQPSEDDASDLDSRVEKLELARRKLMIDREAAPVFDADFKRQWTLGRREDGTFQLLVDPGRPDAAPQRVLLVHNLKQHELQLRWTNRSTNLRWTTAATANAAGAPSMNEELLQRLRFGDMENDGGGLASTLPAVFHEHLAVAPVRGGLLCVGLGPERGGGKRIWEYEIAEPIDADEGFARRAAPGPHGLYFCPREDRVACLGWIDGRPRWQRQFGDLRIDRLALVGSNLVIIGQSGEIVVVDAEFGDRPRTPPVGIWTPEHVQVVGDTIVVATASSLLGLAADSLAVRWERSTGSPAAHLFDLPGRNWFVYRERGSPALTALDAESGKVAAMLDLPAFQEVSAAAVLDDTIVVAGLLTAEGDESRPEVAVAAVDARSGQALWKHRSRHFVPPTVSQLSAHERFIPLLTVGESSGPFDVRRFRRGESLGIRLIDQTSGELGPLRSITENFVTGDSGVSARDVANAIMVATPTRIIVGAGGALAAYGSSRSRSDDGN